MEQVLYNKFTRAKVASYFREHQIDKALDEYSSYINTVEDVSERNNAKVYVIKELQRYIKLPDAGMTNKILCYRELLNMFPHDEEYILGLIDCLAHLGQNDLRLEMLSKFEFYTKDKPRAFRMFAQCYTDMKDYQKAISYYLKCPRYTMLNEHDLSQLGFLYLQIYKQKGFNHLLREAQLNFVKAYKLNNKNIVTLKGLIEVAQYKNLLLKAQKYFLKLIKYYPTEDNFYSYSCFCLDNGLYEYGFDYIQYRNKIDIKGLDEKTEWNGQKTDKKLLIIGEPSLTEDIYFSRFINDVLTKCSSVSLCVRENETLIFKDSFRRLDVYSLEYDVDNIYYDEYIYLADIPRVLGIKELKSESRYLKVNSKFVFDFKNKNLEKDIFNLGVMDYKSSNDYDFPDFTFLSNIKTLNLQIHSLNRFYFQEDFSTAIQNAVIHEMIGSEKNMFELLKEKFYIKNLGKNIYSLYDLAIAVSSMDAILTTNNSLKALAAALGVKVVGVNKVGNIDWSCKSSLYSKLIPINCKSWADADVEAKNELEKLIDKIRKKNFVYYKIDRQKNLLDINPYNYRIMIDIAGMYFELGEEKDLDLALEYTEKTLDVKPIEEYFSLLFDIIKRKYKDKEQLDAEIHKVLDKYDDKSCYIIYAFRLLEQRKYKEGFKYYRFRKSATAPISKPKWDGVENLSESTLLIIAEQGLGDFIMISRYIREAQKLAKKVIMICRKELYSFIKYNFNDIDITIDSSKENFDRFVEEFENLDFDYYIASMDLIPIFNFDGTNYLKSDGYLKADGEKVNEFKLNYIKPETFNIGIAYSGSTDKLFERNIDLKYFYPLSQIKGVQLYSLQYDQPGYSLRNTNIINISEMFNDFSDTAAAIENMDLIISSDNVIAHLAGALNKKTLLLLKNNPEWRWPQEEQDTSGWYDSVKPFIRKEKDEERKDWSELFIRVGREVEKLAITDRLNEIQDSIEFYKKQTKRDTSAVINNKLGVLYMQLYTLTSSQRDINTAIDYLTSACRLDNTNTVYERDLKEAYSLDKQLKRGQ